MPREPAPLFIQIAFKTENFNFFFFASCAKRGRLPPLPLRREKPGWRASVAQPLAACGPRRLAAQSLAAGVAAGSHRTGLGSPPPRRRKKVCLGIRFFLPYTRARSIFWIVGSAQHRAKPGFEPRRGGREATQPQSSLSRRRLRGLSQSQNQT
jgi:hypothetical protein